jgi:hypothetical protein
MIALSLPTLPLNLVFPHRPPGFDTAWSFLLREEPAMLALIRDPVGGLGPEVAQAALIAAASGMEGVEGNGVMAYPVEVWAEVFPGADREGDLTLIIT